MLKSGLTPEFNSINVSFGSAQKVELSLVSAKVKPYGLKLSLPTYIRPT